jgi:hypothetical protein
MVAMGKNSSCVAQCPCSGARILVASMYSSVDLRRRAQGHQRQCTAHAKAGYADLAAAGLQELHRASDILRRRIAEIQPRHQMMRLFGLNRGLAAEEVGHERNVACVGQTVGDAADLFVDPPPFLDDDDCRGTGSVLRLGEVTLNILPVGALEGDGSCHC